MFDISVLVAIGADDVVVNIVIPVAFALAGTVTVAVVGL